MRRNLKILIIVVIALIIIPLSLIINNSIIQTRVYYELEYDVQHADGAQIIDRVETFDYLSNLITPICEFYDFLSGNATKFNRNYIDKEYLNFLINKVKRDYEEFHLWPFHHFYLTYLFNTTEQSKIYLTYNNITIFSVQFEDYEDIIFLETYSPKCDYDYYLGSWYINFSQVPYVLNESVIIPLNNTILVQTTLAYDHLFGNVGGVFFTIRQLVILDSNLNVILVYVPYTQVVCA